MTLRWLSRDALGDIAVSSAAACVAPKELLFGGCRGTLHGEWPLAWLPLLCGLPRDVSAGMAPWVSLRFGEVLLAGVQIGGVGFMLGTWTQTRSLRSVRS